MYVITLPLSRIHTHITRTRTYGSVRERVQRTTCFEYIIWSRIEKKKKKIDKRKERNVHAKENKNHSLIGLLWSRSRTLNSHCTGSPVYRMLNKRIQPWSASVSLGPYLIKCTRPRSTCVFCPSNTRATSSRIAWVLGNVILAFRYVNKFLLCDLKKQQLSHSSFPFRDFLHEALTDTDG